MAELSIEGILSSSDSVTDQFLTQMYPVLANEISGVIYAVAVIYWGIYGYKIYAGYSGLVPKELFTRIVMTFCVFLTLDWNGFASSLYMLFSSFMEGVAATVMAGHSSSSMLQALFDNVGMVSSFMQDANPYQFGVIALGFGMFLLNCLLLCVAVCYMIIAKLGLALTMVLLPIFAGFVLFEQTRQLAQNWFSSMLNFAFLYILVIVIVRIGFLVFGNALEETANAANALDAALITIPQVAQIYIIEGVLIFFMLQVRSWAASLTNGTAHGMGSLRNMLNQLIFNR